MKFEGSFIVDRLAAQHCPELLRGTHRAPDPRRLISGLAGRLCVQFEQRLRGLCGATQVRIRAGEPTGKPSEAASDKRCGQFLNGTILIGPTDEKVMVSLPRRAALTLVDLALGGTGNECRYSDDRLPMSAVIVFSRFEMMVAGVLAEVMEIAEPGMVRPKHAVGAVEMGARCVPDNHTILPLEVTIGDNMPWDISLIFPDLLVSELFASKSGGQSAGSAQRSPANEGLGAEPFEDIPLSVRAVLVDMAMPLAAISNLKPGMVIPVAVARSVPLVAGDKILAHGTVGAMEDRAALQLTRINSSKEK